MANLCREPVIIVLGPFQPFSRHLHYWLFILFLQSTCECVKYYYVSKKGENFKQLARKASFKRKKTFVKSSEMLTLPCSTPPHAMLLDSKQESLTEVKPPSGTHIQCRKHGRFVLESKNNWSVYQMHVYICVYV